MAKKIAFIALVVAALVCGTWGYFYLQDLKKPALKPFDVLPDSCAALLEVKEPAGFITQLTQGNLMWEEFLKIGSVKKFNRVLIFLDSLANDEDTREYLGNEPFYIALYGKGNERQAVYAFNLADVNETERALAFFEKHFSAKKLSAGLYECVLNDEEKHAFYLFCESGLIVAGEDKEFMERLSEKNGKTILSGNKQFMAGYKTAARDKGLGVFLHTPFFYKYYWSAFFQSRQPGNFFSETTERWLVGDALLEPSDINVQGFIPMDSAQVSRAIGNQEMDDFKSLYEHLPYHTFALEAVNLSDYMGFCRDNYRNDSLARRLDLKKYSDSLSASAQTEISSFAGKYLGAFKATAGDTSYEYGIMDVSDAEKAISFFKAVSDSTLLNSDTANLFLFNDKSVFPLLSARFFTNSFAYVTVVNESAVFSNSVKAILEYRKAAGEKINFSTNERAMRFVERNFNSDLNYIYYCDVFKNRKSIRNNLSASFDQTLEESPELFEKFDAIGFSLQKMKGSIFYKGHLGFNPKNKMYQNTLWEALADTDLYQIPTVVINHKTNEKELICQDINNNLYLVSNTGKILWKRNIAERMLGAPVQVDHFANGKLQLLFASENYIHLIDRNGNYVQGFPVKIKTGASGGLTIFDYDNTKNYRLWLPLKNKTVICLNMACKVVEGFVPVNLKAISSKQVTHLLLQQKDYFIITDTTGNVYAANRKGEQRLTFANKVVRANSPLYIEVGKDISKTSLCFVDLSSKTLRKLSLADKMEISLLKSDIEPGNYFFDTLQEGNKPFVFLVQDKKIHQFDLYAAKTLEIKLAEECDGRAEALLFGTKKVYAALEKENGRLLLLDAKTQIPIDNTIQLSALPASYDLIKGQPSYLLGFYRNKIFCIKP